MPHTKQIGYKENKRRNLKSKLVTFLIIALLAFCLGAFTKALVIQFINN